jgi:hypothetical protein
VRRNRVQVQALTHGAGEIDGAEFELNGLKFLLRLSPPARTTLKYRPGFLRDKQHGATQQVIRFTWSSAR